MKTLQMRQRRGWRRLSWWCALACLGALNAWSQSPVISGYVVNRSVWADNNAALTPPGDGDGSGSLVVGVWAAGVSLAGPPVSLVTAASGAMPFTFGGNYIYSLTLATGGAYQVVGFVDADSDGAYDLGEPRSASFLVQVGDTNTVTGVNPTVTDSSEGDTLPDWWEAHWFGLASDPLASGDNGDPDGDGLANSLEYGIAIGGWGMDTINPADWDTDRDGMDDYWEWKYYAQSLGIGGDPTASNRVADVDGDGLSIWQEYCGVDGNPRMVLDAVVDGVRKGKLTPYEPDDLNPLDIDTDFDLLIDSFEAAWYDVAGGIDPAAGVLQSMPRVSGDYSLSIAAGDPDNDGLTSYREMCLHEDLREGSASEDKWLWPNDSVPFPQTDYFASTPKKERVRVCLMSFSGSNLNLGLVMDRPIPATTNRFMLRNHAWTDPTANTGYHYVDENISPGWDTDGDLLPDGWEVEFNVDPRDPGMGPSFDHGAFGDPDGDGILNWYEFVGPDGLRSQTKPYINGSGDETNPYQHNHRPDSTYLWRWMLTNAPYSGIVDPRVGFGISRNETLGSALPTISLGVDNGWDTDDDGLTDFEEAFINLSNPADSSDPFVKRSLLITSTNGILIRDPEPELGGGLRPAGVREDLQRRNWTIECYVKLLTNGLTGYLLRFQTRLGALSQVVYSLELTNDVPVLRADFGAYSAAVQAKALPINRWVHLAGVWDAGNRALNLYVDGVLQLGQIVTGSGNPGDWLFPATNLLAIGASRNGSFVGNLLIDEVRIWGLARTGKQINRYSTELLPQSLADDVWLAISFQPRTNLYFNRSINKDVVLVNGGSLFEGEPGVVLSNAVVTYRNHPTQPGVFDETESVWVDNGDGIFRIADDVIIWNSGALREGDLGVPLTAYRQNNMPAVVVYADKDESGGYTPFSLLAYYRFDDGGATVEDFARKAKNGLFGTSRENYMFGDGGYALATGNVLWVTNEYAPLYGATARGADDSDKDRMPDAWEIRYGLDAFDDGTVLESGAGKKDGPNGAKGDWDGDGLMNVCEYWANTNPRNLDSDGDGVPDTEEDWDGDGVGNLVEQRSGSRPDLVDTDDDGVSDIEELANSTNPADATDPAVSRGIWLGGGMEDFLEVPRSLKQQLGDWTVEAWIKPSSVPLGQGYIVRRVVEQLAGSSNAVNFQLGVESNGAGGLRVFAGYVLTDGRTCIVRGGTLATGEWIHVAATYSNATLTIYTNGAVAVSSNSVQFVTPPANGRGGDSFLRIGEGFHGVVDEVRIWSGSRSAGLIYTNYNRTVQRTSSGLVHYFRFDDGQAVTNVFPFSPYHNPGGAQDFVYTDDWDVHWRHAARLFGNAQFVAPGSTVSPPSLRVVITPEEAVTAGAQWALDGGNWQNSGVTLYDLTPGTHSVLFKSLSGWTAPGEIIVALSNGTATVLTRRYQKNSSLIVTLLPSELTALARWQVDGGMTRMSGELVGGLAPGDHLITYSDVGGWIAPTWEIVAIPEGATVSLVRSYSANIGYLRVNLQPTNAVLDGAQWRVDDGLWNNSGNIVALQVGSHAVGYKDLPGWIEPSTDVVTVAYGTTTTLVRTYEANPGEDSDGDGLPDLWEVLYGLNSFDATGNNGASGDPDGDDLVNIFEYWCGTNPLNADTDGDGTWDGDEDADGDGLTNAQEASLSTRPDRTDTDDDGWSDGAEIDRTVLKQDMWHGRRTTGPAYSRSPWVARSLQLTGSPIVAGPAVANYLGQKEWMIDLWYMPTSSVPVTGRLVQRVTQNGLTNFCLRLINGVPVVEFQTPQGVVKRLQGGVGIATNEWTRLLASWKPDSASLELLVNEQSFMAEMLASVCASGTGVVQVGDAGLGGYLDNLVIRNPSPQDVVLVLDVSGSMFGTKLKKLKETAKLALDLLPEDTPVALIPFSSTATNLSGGFTLDRMRLRLLIDSLSANGETSYKSAIDELTNVVIRYSTYERHLCLFLSDGVPTDPASLEQILAARDLRIKIDTVGFELSDPAELQKLSDLTGGTFYDVPRVDRLLQAFEGILEQIFKVRYVFDDGGSMAEDVAHVLNWAYALSNVTISANAYVDPALSGDFDLEPPAWWQDWFFGGGVAAWSDVDGDGLSTLYEYWCDTHPLVRDTEGDGVLDGHEDYDEDGLNNADEQTHGSDPRLADTDDDGIGDLSEKLNGTAANYSLSPLQMRTLRLAGGAGDYVEMPRDRRFALQSWTIEAWVCPEAGWLGDGIVVRRVVVPGVTNFFLSVDSARRPRAGFGAHQVFHSAPIPADGTTWTHLAATYNGLSQELMLYVNATQVARTVCSANPEVNGVGPLIQRIGERWKGQLDEIRLWNVVRSPEQLASAYLNPLTGDAEGLVAYYRFDDGTSESASANVGTSGNNLTNGWPNVSIARWNWGQVEDFTLRYSIRDWTNRWRNAATLLGNAVITNAPGAVQPQPSVRVLLYPSGAVAAGAKWALNGSNWKDSGEIVSLLGTGLAVNISYRDAVYGWTPPTNETVILTNGQALTLTRYYRQNGTLTVSLQPMAAASNGAQWSVDGGLSWNNSDVTISNLSPGGHAVIFKNVAGWITPAATNVTVSEGGAAFAVATYDPLVAPLYAVIEPAEAITNGAQWRVDGGAWTNSGAYVTVGYGGHTVEFRPLSGWVTPNSIAVSVADAAPRTVTGTYRRITGLQVFIEPVTAQVLGASWRLAGGGYYASGVLLEINPGTYTIDFLPLAGWMVPPTQRVTVVSNSITIVNARYYQYELIPTNMVGLFSRPRGIAFDSQRRLYIADSMNNRIVVYDTRTGAATNFGGPIATNTLGMFNQPLAVALDDSDNLYVADGNNHRIQRRNAQTGVWTVWGGSGSGTNVGQFNTPFDIAVDRFTNVYVADHYNHRIQQRVATNGQWVVLISNGFLNGWVRFPSGVEVDPSNRLYVSDFPSTNDGPRIQVFSTNGVFIEQIGGRSTALGGMERPYRMDFGLSNDLFLAEWGLDAAMRKVGTNLWESIVGFGQLNNPEGVAYEDRGYLYIADTDNQRIIRVLVNEFSTNVPPSVSGVVLGPSGMVISWLGAIGWFYTVQYTDTGFDPWFDVPGCSMIGGTNGVMSCTDTNNFGIPSRIYRIVYY